ncbi:GNAT family N-acetyltransferase [Pandoraea terrae]|uniref:GNAT family N-acetyltransferase n=1 Tax=Pandoraea terrae TaxID=1537710 RepID=A0A5E4RAD4_9BURK|nr:GNAT family N-acetyltransferase [Pandoraea terrae]VVD59733.1 GNAT family N-acetyltransferase [Pandoraea terrae]
MTQSHPDTASAGANAPSGIVDISADPRRLDIPLIHHWLSTQTHWARDIPRETLMRAIGNSLCFGAYASDIETNEMQQVGFARVITDNATFAYLADVFVIESMRGRGIGKRLVEAVLAHPALQNLRRFLLATSDAAGLYAQYGFAPLGPVNNMMQIHRPDVYTRKNAA